MGPALEGVPVTEFNEPAPIQVITDKISRAARTGIDPGAQRRPSGTGVGGPYILAPAAPKAEPPPPTTTTVPPAPTTTTTRPAGASSGAGAPGSTTTTTEQGGFLRP
jgi:hypothetical protein